MTHTDNKSLVERAEGSLDMMIAPFAKQIIRELLAALQNQQGSVDAQNQPKVSDKEACCAHIDTNCKVDPRDAIIAKLKEGLSYVLNKAAIGRQMFAADNSSEDIVFHLLPIEQIAQQTLEQVKQMEEGI